MGNPVSIVDLAQRMIDFYWKGNDHSLGVEFSGLRPGEKLDEQLTYPYETVLPTKHPLVKEVCAKAGSRTNGHGTHFEQALSDLIALAEEHGDRRALVAALMLCVPEYSPLDRMPLEAPVSMN